MMKTMKMKMMKMMIYGKKWNQIGKKQEAEKKKERKGMSNLLEKIRNKHKKQNKKPLSPKLKNKKYPKINIQKFDDNLKIRFPSSSSYKKDKTEKKKKHN